MARDEESEHAVFVARQFDSHAVRLRIGCKLKLALKIEIASGGGNAALLR